MKHTIHTKDGGLKEIDNYTRGLAIKAMCTECMGWGDEHPKECTCPKCPLFPYRAKTQIGYKSDEDKKGMGYPVPKDK